LRGWHLRAVGAEAGGRSVKSERGEVNMDIIQIRQKLATNNASLKERFHVKELGVFGSLITGHQTRRSDVDILVTFDKGHKDFFNYMRLKSCLEELTGMKVDLVMKDALKPRLRGKILNEVEYV
jgi:predicted nucleotidyltransferase